jgi:hypothetical protein
MSDFEQAVFISYAWGGESEELVNQIDRSLQERGIKIIRDKRDLGYKGSISEFMGRIGQGNCVIVVISDKYLRSKNCMFELVEIAENKQFADRVFPIVLSDAKIYDPVDRLDYVQYWEAEKVRLNEKIKKLLDVSNLQGINDELNNYDHFRDRISGLTSTLKDMNTLTSDMHRDSDYSELFAAIEKRMKESIPAGSDISSVQDNIHLSGFQIGNIHIPNNTRMATLVRNKIAKNALRKVGLWGSILPNINEGHVIPIVSSSFRMEQIFHELAGEDESTIVEQLIAEWAEQIGYPMQDSYNLAQVAQFFFVDENDGTNERAEIIRFLNRRLWELASANPENYALAASLESRVETIRFSDLVEKLRYPKFPAGTEDPLRTLARFPLPIYITTAQSDFLERALVAEGKTPCTQICFWSGEIPDINQEHRTKREFIPSVTNPLVYHLYGLEDYPQTLVLSEDDYINYLIAVAEDKNNLNPKIPLYLRKAIGESQLLLIGYRLSGWDFRVLFRLIMKFRIEGLSPKGMLIQLRHKEYEPSNDKTIRYMTRYFGKKAFEIDWDDAGTFIQKLCDDWNAQRQDQL